jgi:hypothetical protein
MDTFYGWLLDSTSECGFFLGLGYQGMQGHDLSELEGPSNEDMVWSVILLQELDKSPGPDSFTGRFYTSYWGIIKPDIMVRSLPCRMLMDGGCMLAN